MDLMPWVEAITVPMLAISAVIALLQWKSTTRMKKAEMVYSLLDRVRSDPIMQDAWYLLEYSQDWYNNDFHESPQERSIDKLLAHLTYVCYLRKSRCVTDKEFKFFDYQIRSVSSNAGMQCYLHNLSIYACKNDGINKSSQCSCKEGDKTASCFSFQYLFDYCKERGYFPEGIGKQNCKLYPLMKFNLEPDFKC